MNMPAVFNYYRKRSSAPSLDTVITSDTRAPVLYLRAFYQETSVFTWGTREVMAQYTDNPVDPGNRWLPLDVTFEQYFTAAFSKTVGPLVALGNPEDFLQPEGAARLYANDADWRSHFTDYAERAAAIVMENSASDNLEWELKTILIRDWTHKFWVITPPLPQSKFPLHSWKIRFFRFVEGIPYISWSKFCKQLRKVGFTIDIKGLAPGSVIGFDCRGRAQIIAEGIQQPNEYVDAIARHFKSDIAKHDM